jgi:phosphoribosylformylglycinamidine synthase
MKPGEVKVCVLRIEGTNCETESFQAFERLGAKPEMVHLKQLLGQDVRDSERRNLMDYHILMIPGGFSSGDYVRAGAIFAARMKSKLAAPLAEYIREGRAVLGVCNGFQVLVEMGFLPGLEGVMSQTPDAVLTTNDSSRFECRPTLLKYENNYNCIFTHKIKSGQVLLIPSAHAEGKLLFPQDRADAIHKQLEDNDQIVFRYVSPDGDYAGYPWNPNGSPRNIAGICNPSGNVMGMMPHPERVFHRFTHPDWTRGFSSELGDGRVIFESVLESVTKRF